MNYKYLKSRLIMAYVKSTMINVSFTGRTRLKFYEIILKAWQSVNSSFLLPLTWYEVLFLHLTYLQKLSQSSKRVQKDQLMSKKLIDLNEHVLILCKKNEK